MARRVADPSAATGELAERVMYQAYGATEQDTRPTRWGSHREPLRFTGKEDDVEVGLSYFGARYYAPNLGQWASADPLTVHAFGADPNPYAYVAGRVATHVDPFGLNAQDGYDEVTVRGVRPHRGWSRDLDHLAREYARRAVAWNNRAQRVGNSFTVGVLHSVELTPIPGGPSLGGALEAAGAVGPSSEETAAKVVGQLIGLGVTFAVGAELNAAAAADLPAAASAVEDAATNAKGLVAGGRTYINSSRVVERAAAEPGAFHNFPGSFDQVILEQGEQKLTVAFFKQPKAGYGASGVQYTLPGTVNGQQGVFEIGTRLSTSGKVELIMHRFFRPTR